MEAILKRNNAMSVEDLTRLTVRELRNVSNANWIFCNALAILNLVLFYHSLFVENWLLLFVSFGFFITSLAVYDNYKLSKKYLNRAQNQP
jgi:hypothetical protein